MKARRLLATEEDSWRNIPITLIDRGRHPATAELPS
jgi:hypothetical protein